MALNEQLKKMILDALPGVECVIGWGPGPDALHGSPLFMRSPEDVDLFSAGPLSVQNTALFLPEYKGRKVGVVVKGCDSRSVAQLLAENLIAREDVVIIGFPCNGVVDLNAVAAKLGELEPGLDPGEISACAVEKENLRLTSLSGAEYVIALPDVLAGKCRRCLYPNAVLRDYFAGVERPPFAQTDDFSDLKAFENIPVEERLEFWRKEMSRCIRCYACRNACPLCVCRDHCVAASRDPHWLTQSDSVRDKMFFQVIHATHLAGRCTGCGECQRACPVGLPVGLFKRAMGRGVEELFGFAAGLDPEATPPLQTFQITEEKIKEKEW